MDKVRILLGDDHPLFLDGGRRLLEQRYEIVGTASDGRALVQAALSLKPGLIILDISMPLLSGIEAARRIKASLPEVKLLFFTMHHERPYLQAAFEVGAAGYLLKSATSEELLRAIQEIQKGNLYFPKELSEHGRFLRDPDQIAKSLRLSSREQEVLNLIAEGRSSKEMASILNISVKTISFHRENIKHKLGVRTIAELTKHAIAKGFV
ncbi:MAG TPA: response regulator transcription factor [Bryobacteraceae bacterium]|nr:response regulator transcription factor [Bryobacteraceae bacterium]